MVPLLESILPLRLTGWRVDSLTVRLERNERIPAGERVQLFLNDNPTLLGQSNAYSDWSEHNEVTFGTTPGFSWNTTNQYLEVRIPKFSGGYSAKGFTLRRFSLLLFTSLMLRTLCR